MKQRFSLETAGQLFGISTSAMRARAKKYPEKYGMERDNSSKIWLWIDPDNLPAPKAKRTPSEGSDFGELKASIEAFKVQGDTILKLRENVAAETARADAAERARDQAEADRDAWRGIAEKMANEPKKGIWSLFSRARR